MKFFASIILLCITATVIAQRRCQPRIISVKPNQRICERVCMTSPKSPVSRCAVARAAATVRVCPSNCCRLGSGCQYVITV